ncbi:MAG TPA: hypothetical protein VH703_04465 [Solirubrobacterales bacterium]
MLLAALGAASAQAAPEIIAEDGTGAGQVHNALSVAVDQSTGDLYVAEGSNNKRVSKFDSNGDFLLAWGWGVADESDEFQICGPAASPPTSRCFAGQNPDGGLQPAGAVYADSVAVDQSSGAVYVPDGSNHRVSKFTSSGQFVFMVGRNVNKTKVADGGATQAEKNICTAASGDTCGKGESGTGPNEFLQSSFPYRLSAAVDSSGVVWVGDDSRIASFDSSGAYVSEAAIAGAGGTVALGIDAASGDFYAISASLAGVRRYEPSGTPVNTLTLTDTLDAADEPQSLAVDSGGNLFVDDCGPAPSNLCPMSHRLKVFNPAGEQVSQFGAGQVATALFANAGPQGNALALDGSAGALYAAVIEGYVKRFAAPEPGPLPEDQHVEDLEPTTVTLAAKLNPEGHETSYHFEWGTSESYGESTPTETLAGTGFDSEAVAAELEELIPETTYHFRLVATNHCNNAEPAEECTVAGPDTTFTTRPAVAIDAQWATDVTARSAVVHAEIDPIGVEAEWWVEYGTDATYGSQSPASSLEAGLSDVSLATLFTGLEPGTTYHYRFVASDERDGTEYTVHGADRSFTTQLSGLGFSLADNRAWEMVSPAQKYGARISFVANGQIQAAGDGEAVTYLSVNSTEAHPEGNRAIESSSTLARRGVGGAWSNRDITPPHTEVTFYPLGLGLEYKLFSADLSRGLLDQRDSAPLSPEASERTPYLRQNTEPATYIPLLTGKEGFANVPAGTEFGGDPEAGLAPVQIKGATPDLSHILLGSSIPLVEGVSGGAFAPNALYEWAGGQLRPASVQPEGEGGAVVGGGLGGDVTSLRKAVSDDGSRVFWTANGGGLYVRDMDREETVRLDVVQPGAYGTGAANPVFQGADAAGTVAFFTDSRNLTEDANQQGRDLYRCEVTVESEELGCELTDISANGDESAEVQGISGMGDDATHVYFVARGVLDVEANGQGEVAVPDRPNLYRWQEGAGTRFVATLSGEDFHGWGAYGAGTLCCRASQTSAAASPSGRYLAFMSERSLTGYDNRDAVTGEKLEEVFRYDAATDELICASCNPSGASPRGLVPGDAGLLAQEFDPQFLWSGRAVAAVLPEATKLDEGGVSLYRPRAVHDNGRLFFNAADSLVPADSNGNGDVYEYEPMGLGDCTASSGAAATSRAAGGCVSLISSGTNDGTSSFLDASVGGDDVFFYTAAQLSVSDEDHVNDVYDARVDGVMAKLTPRAECLGEACQPAVNPPNDPTPASASFKGAGNLRFQPDCGAIARRTARLSRLAQALRRQARKAKSPKAKRRMSNRAGRISKRAQALGKRTKRCRRANRRAGR